MCSSAGGTLPDQYRKLVGYSVKYPYLVGIRTKSAGLGTGILISPRLVLTCNHVLCGFTSAEVVSQERTTSARPLKIDEFLDLALLELEQPISDANANFTDSPLRPGVVLLAVGVQSTPGKPHELSVAEIELQYLNQNDADGKILDIQLTGGARPGYSGGPILLQEGGAMFCVGVMSLGGRRAYSTSAVGLGTIRAFVAEYLPSASLQEGKLGTKVGGNRQLRKNSSARSRPLIFTAILCGAVIFCTLVVWHYLSSHSADATGGTVIAATQKPGDPALGQSALGESRLSSPSQDPGAFLNLEMKESSLQKDATPTAPTRIDPGNPDVMIWVNTPSNLYHCPGTRWYGKTKHGEYMTQADAQKKAYQPAHGKACK